MSAARDARRKLLGPAAVKAAEESVRTAPPFTPEQFAALVTLFRKPRKKQRPDADVA